MADNYLEKQYESYLARKASMGKKTTKKKLDGKSQRLQPEALEALKEIIDQPSIRMPFDIFREQLYSAESLYKAYQPGKPLSFRETFSLYQARISSYVPTAHRLCKRNLR